MLPVPRTSFEGLNRGSQSWIDRFARRGITLVNFRIRVEMHTEWKNKNDAASRRVVSAFARESRTKERDDFANLSRISKIVSEREDKRADS